MMSVRGSISTRRRVRPLGTQHRGGRRPSEGDSEDDSGDDSEEEQEQEGWKVGWRVGWRVGAAAVWCVVRRAGAVVRRSPSVVRRCAPFASLTTASPVASTQPARPPGETGAHAPGAACKLDGGQGFHRASFPSIQSHPSPHPDQSQSHTQSWGHGLERLISDGQPDGRAEGAYTGARGVCMRTPTVDQSTARRQLRSWKRGTEAKGNPAPAGCAHTDDRPPGAWKS
ncbi:hypothetical protein HYPSUDRAFT_215729 [Hypholoma sublateritium FD-334 SS-4]|uniref:Uncharacterized protein n=1 Tax=Hypholoma sublateritium (strain FD-334 SS-4) TaxID=945553 RepID=A0A0D2P1E1_HYPSF|nr:hypothetical protein HYPSUDRAFT_215729 [Hypholoma sublateritium FD-334 SS-4]